MQDMDAAKTMAVGERVEVERAQVEPVGDAQLLGKLDEAFDRLRLPPAGVLEGRRVRAGQRRRLRGRDE